MITLLRKLSWDSDTDERADLGLEDGTQMKVQVGTDYDFSLFLRILQAWDTNSQNGKYLTGIEAQRVIVEGMRKKVETMKTMLTPAMSNKGSMFNFPIGSSIHRSDCHKLFK